MKTKILVADDEELVRRALTRALGSQASEIMTVEDGVQALRLAEAEKPDLILLDIRMPHKDGLSVLRELRRSLRTRTIPVILVTGEGQVASRIEGFENGADDYVCKPFDIGELNARVSRLLLRSREDIGANPLTRLPGNRAIEEEVNRRLGHAEPFCLLYADIDRFKSYNDHYGFAKGDGVIRDTARVLECASRAGRAPAFLGHIGGDDFVLVADAADADAVAQRAVMLFDIAVAEFYATEDFSAGRIVAKDRAGREVEFPLIRLTVGIASTEQRAIAHYGEAVQIACEMKAFLKGRTDQSISRFAFDRRRF